MFAFTVFVAASVGAFGALQLLLGLVLPDRGRMHRRMDEEFGPQARSPSDALYKDSDALGDMDGADAGAVPEEWTVPALPSVSPRERLEDVLRQAGVRLTADQFFGITFGCGFGLAAAGLWFGGWLGGVMGFAAGCATPVLALDARWKARRDRLLKQLVGAFELMARVLRTGQSVPEALRGAVEAFDEPLAGEFAGCLHQIEMGIRQDTAFRGLVGRSSAVELRLFVTAMTIHRQAGGNLSEVLDRLAALVRARLQLRRKIRSLTAEGRLQSVTLVVLPVVTFGVMLVLNRQYAEQLLAHTQLLLATAGFMAVGVVWIRRILDFEG